MIAIIDYGAGNLHSVKKAFDYLNVESQIVSDPTTISKYDKIVLPGVGAFGSAMEKLQESGFYSVLKNRLDDGAIFLGICLGMQMLLGSSDESPGVTGLDVFEGNCSRFTQGKVPLIGWNKVEPVRNSKLFTDIPKGEMFYFVHSFYAVPADGKIVSGETNYNIKFPSVFESGNIFAVQFHPEKSGNAGLKLLKNWVEL